MTGSRTDYLEIGFSFSKSKEIADDRGIKKKNGTRFSNYNVPR